MARCKTCENGPKPGYIYKSYPAPPDVIYGFAPYWPCPSCYGSKEESCCEGAVGGPNEIPGEVYAHHPAQIAK